MADYKEGFKSDYVAAIDMPVGREVTVKIIKIELKKVPDRKGKLKDRWVVTFEGAEKPMLLIRTNAEAIVAMFGKDTDGWLRKSITFAVETIRMYDEDAKEMKDTAAIRVVGSPELREPKTFTLRLPRKTDKEVMLRPTGQRAPRSQAGEPPAGRTPGQEG